MSMPTEEHSAPRTIATPLQFEPQYGKLRRARSPLHILIIEDDPVTQGLLQGLFASQYCVAVCADPYRAVNEYLRITPDLVFLDIDLGDKQFNGIDVLHTLRVIDHDASVVILSGMVTPQNIASAARTGAMGFVAKPFKRSVLMQYAQDCEKKKVHG